jgi:predicted nucleic acid-binding protein
VLYLDASALVKRYIEEEGTEMVLAAMEEEADWAICRIGYVETVRAIGLAGGRRAVKAFEGDWDAFNVVEVDRDLAERAAALALSAELRSLDALHLAAALVLPANRLTIVTWDARLHHAADAHGLRTVPESLN